METFLDSALFIKDNGKLVAIKWLDTATHTVMMFNLSQAGIEEEKELLDKCIAFQSVDKPV